MTTQPGEAVKEGRRILFHPAMSVLQMRSRSQCYRSRNLWTFMCFIFDRVRKLCSWQISTSRDTIFSRDYYTTPFKIHYLRRAIYNAWTTIINFIPVVKAASKEIIITLLLPHCCVGIKADFTRAYRFSGFFKSQTNHPTDARYKTV